MPESGLTGLPGRCILSANATGARVMQIYLPIAEVSVNAFTLIGLGGLGHMGVKLAAAMGAHVTMITTTPSKGEDARAPATGRWTGRRRRGERRGNRDRGSADDIEPVEKRRLEAIVSAIWPR